MPNASVFPLKHQESTILSRIHHLAETDLPVSAIPTTSLPFKAGGQLHACIGVGSLNPANADRISGGTSSCENFITGVMGGSPLGVCNVMECFSKKALASEAVVGASEKVKFGFVDEILHGEDNPTEVE